ncbi:MAG: PDZ domain-containing protein [Actinomycetota bacterium]
MSKRLIVFLTLLSIIVIVGSYVSLPYYSEAPGPAREVTPLIQFTRHPRYDSQGHLVLTSVLESVQRLTALGVVGAWLDPNRSVVPENELLFPGETQAQEQQRSVSQMDQSKLDAVASVLKDLDGYPAKHGKGVLVESVIPGCPAEGKLFPGDLITEINGEPVHVRQEAMDAIDAVPLDEPVRFSVTAGGSSETVSVSRERCGPEHDPLVGISTLQNFPFDVTIQSGDIAGPSAGLMWALGFYDLLTPGDLTQGRTIAGTGAIDRDGKVYRIGGVAEKLVAAQRAGAGVFLVPQQNYAEARAANPGIRLVPVSSLQDAVDFLKGGG